jgi:DNA invertase Pin-like site-specific DNA recombinase
MAPPTVRPRFDRDLSVALYNRVSSKRQAEHGLSLQAQAHQLHKRASEQWPDHPTVELADEGISAWAGSTKVRYGFEDLRALVRDGRLQAVVLAAADRLARNLEEALAFVRECNDNGVELWTLDQGQLGTRGDAKMMTVFLLAMAEASSDNKSEHVRRAKADAARRGLWVHGPKPFGYRRDPDTRVLVVHEEEARTVREVFERFAAGESLLAVARRVGTSAQNVRNWLDNEVYIGRIKCGEEWFEGAHPPLIGEALWRRVRQRRAQNAIAARHPRVQPYGTLLRCDQCGHPTSFHRATSKCTYYRCKNRACARYCAVTEYVDAAVVFGLAAVGLTLHERLDDPTWAVAYPDSEALAAVENRLAELTQTRETITALISEDLLDAEEAKARLLPLARERVALEQRQSQLSDGGRQQRVELAALRDSIHELTQPAAHGEAALGALIHWWDTSDIDTRRQFLHETLAQIDIHDDSLILAFHAGITLPVPLKSGQRDPRYSTPLRELGFGHSNRAPPPALDANAEKRTRGARIVPGS